MADAAQLLAGLALDSAGDNNDSALQDAVRRSLLAGDVAQFRAALPASDASDEKTQLVFLMNWFHRWQQEYEAFAEVLEAELADADEEEEEDEEEKIEEVEEFDEGAEVVDEDKPVSTRDIQFVEKDLEDLEAEANEMFKGFRAVAVAILDALADPFSVSSLLDKYGWTLLMQAANTGLRELLDVLLAKGVDVNSSGEDKDGVTPLYLAVSSDHTNEAMVLLKHGAITSATALVRSTGEKSEEGEEPFVEEDCALFQACRLGQLAVLEEMVARGVDLNFSLPTSGDRALHVAVMFEMQDVVELLVVRKSISVNATNASGQTCLFGCSNVDLVEFLVKKGGVDPRIKDVDGETAFSIAKELGDEEVGAFLKPLTV